LRRDIHRYKEKHHVGNYFDRRFGVAVIGGAAHMASQPTVGLLPEWRTWLDSYGSDHPVGAGSDLAGGNVCGYNREPNEEDSFRKHQREVNQLMPLINVIVVLIVVGIILGLINRFIPMAGSIKSILNAVVIIAVVLWLLNVFGILSQLSTIRVGR
jgi:hypothetical protein